MAETETETEPETAPQADAVTRTPEPEMQNILAKLAEFAQLIPKPAGQGAASLDTFRDVPITITAKLGHAVLPIGDILKLGQGAVVELQEAVNQPIELTVRGVPFAVGEIVVVEDRFAVRIKALLPPRGAKADS